MLGLNDLKDKTGEALQVALAKTKAMIAATPVDSRAVNVLGSMGKYR